MSRYRTFVAFGIAPVSFGLLLAVISLFSAAPLTGLWAIMFSGLIGYPIAIVVGLPIYLWFSRKGYVGILAYAALSILISVIVIGYLVVWPAMPFDSSLNHAPRIALAALLVFASFFSVFTFWLIDRPDRRRERSS